MSKESTEILIIGGGIVGLSIAYQLIERKICKNIIIIDKEMSLGMHTSGRNSGVLHAGIYYKPGSLKAKVCIEGSKRLQKWIKERSLSINKCGKIILPTKNQLDHQLDLLLKRGKTNGAVVEMIDKKRLYELEPYAESSSDRALWSPNTVVINPKEILMQIENELIEKGVLILKNQTIKKIFPEKKEIHTNDNSIFKFKYFFNCAGLQSDRIAHLCNVGEKYTILPFKGLYWKLKNSNKFNIKTNIYPVPDLSVPFLGVHFTPNAEKIRTIYIGPTATIAWGRENYKSINTIEPLMSITNLFILSQQYLLNKNKFRNYVHEQAFQSFEPFLIKAAKKLIPSLSASDIEFSDKLGIRAQLFDKQKMNLVDDFICINDLNSTHVLNAISPAFTSSFSLADLIINSSNVLK